MSGSCRSSKTKHPLEKLSSEKILAPKIKHCFKFHMAKITLGIRLCNCKIQVFKSVRDHLFSGYAFTTL